MKIIGIKKLDFTIKEGDVIKGQQLVLTGPIEPNKGEGEEAEKFFCPLRSCPRCCLNQSCTMK